MKLNSLFIVFFFLLLGILPSCSGGGSGGSGGVAGGGITPTAELAKYLAATGPNVMKVSVSGSLCSSYKYLNEPCVEVTICEPGTNNCQTIDNILLDTGSYGLRIFKSKISINVTNILEAGSGNQYGACATFGSGASWGYVAAADVILGDLSLGGVKAASVPFQVIDSTFQNSSSKCNSGDVDTTPANAMFNGILGIGFFAQDCGSYCTTSANNGVYFSCIGDTCTKSVAPLAKQVANPVPKLDSDNNGYVIALPGVTSAGSPSVDGVMILGIGTRDNNVPYDSISVVTVNNSYGYASATYTNKTSNTSSTGLSALIDSGTNGWAFSDTTITNCPSPSAAFYCPSATVSGSVLLTGTNSNSITNTFSVANAYSLSASNDVFVNIGFELSSISHMFILGLPHMLGKSIFVGVEGGTSTLNQNLDSSHKLYWAY